MPVISPTRYSTTTGSSSSYLPPSIGGTTSSLAKASSYTPSSYHTSNYRSSSLSNSSYSSSGGYSSSYLRASYRSSLPSASSSVYRSSSYLTGGNNDTTATSRFVSSNRYSRASSDRDTLKRNAGKTQYNNSNTINTSSRSKALQSKPPIGALSSSIRHQRTPSLDTTNRSRDNSLTRVTSKSDPNSNCIDDNDTNGFHEQTKNNKISSSLSSSSLARQVATSGLDLYEKYSPAHYIPKCELSRSRSLSEATSSSNKSYSNDRGLSNSSSNVQQLLQAAKESKQHIQQNQNENDLKNLNLKSSSPTPSSSSYQTSPSTSAKDISKVKKLCAVSTSATTNHNNNHSKFATGSVVVISNSQCDANAFSHTTKHSLNTVEATGSTPSTPPHSNLVVAVGDFKAKSTTSAFSNGYRSHAIDDSYTHSTDSVTATVKSSLKSSPKQSSFVVVTNNNINPSEHDILTSSKHSNSNNVIKTATTVQFEQHKTNSSLASNSAPNNSVTSQSIYKKFPKSNPTSTTIATTCASASTATSISNSIGSRSNATATNSKITSSPSILSSSVKSTAFAATAVTSSASSSQKLGNSHNASASDANALLQAAKSNLKPTPKPFLNNQPIEDKTMTSLYSETNGNTKAHTRNLNNRGSSTTTIISINNSAAATSTAVNAPSSLVTESVVDKAKHFETKNTKTNALDAHLEFYRNKLQPVGSTKVTNTRISNGGPVSSSSTPSSSTSSPSSSKGGNNSRFIGLTYREPNFLKTECDLARSQVAKASSSSSEPEFSADNNNPRLNGSSVVNNNNNNLIVNNLATEKAAKKYEKNLIKPLVHKTTNSKQQSQQLSRTPSNNNMNVLQNGGGPDLDDIKYIDSDDSERQHNGHSYDRYAVDHTHHEPRRSTTSRLNAGGVASIYASPPRTLSERKDMNNKLSTLPLTSKHHHRDVVYTSDNSKNVTSKYNTLNDFKRLPSSSLSSSLRSGLHKNVELISSSSSSSSSPSSTTTTPVKTYGTTSAVSLAKSSPVVMVHQQQQQQQQQSNGTASHESTPSTSPQIVRRRNALSANNSALYNSNDSLSSTVKTAAAMSSSTSSHQQPLSPLVLSTAQNNATRSSAGLDDQSLSNKNCDNDESVRNSTSSRSALASSPTPSRYWDREGRSSLVAGRSYDTDTENSTSKSTNSHDSTSTEGLCGLRNIGNTCFMNSVIQCLSHTRELTKFLKTQVNTKSSTKDQQILHEFAKLIREMWSPNVRSVTPLELKSAFSSKHRMYSGYNQQDAQEFLRFFLDSLHSALNNGVKGEPLNIDDSLSDNKKADLTWEWYSKIENSVIRDLFVGQLKSTLKCTTCGNTSVTFDPFWDLSVPLPSSSRCKLDACLDLFIREEVLDGDEMPTCSKCKARRKCTKSFTIQRFPKYLAIHLKRFSETRWSKMSNVVEIPTGERELNMAPYASNANVSATYSLYGISNHMGSTAGGHYVALCKHPVTKKWHEFNDNIVSDDLSESVLVSSSAYLLFYERA